MVKQDLKQLKTKKKKWYPILAPELFNNTVVGETIKYEAEDAIGDYVETNLMSLTNDMKNQHYNVKLVITGHKDGNLTTRIVGYSMIAASLKRLIRRRNTRMDDSFGLKTKDGIRIRVKPLLITRGKVKGSIETVLRAKLKRIVIKFITENDYDVIFKEVAFAKLQRSIREQLSKTYPVKDAEIRMLKEETKAEAEKARLKEAQGDAVDYNVIEEAEEEKEEEEILEEEPAAAPDEKKESSEEDNGELDSEIADEDIVEEDAEKPAKKKKVVKKKTKEE
ncbi:MAG: hypothetical protein V1859_06315 [archaeon]